MSDRATRIEELNDKSRPDCRAELKTAVYDASGKALRAIAKHIDPEEKDWATDDEECQTQAVKKTLRLQKPQLIDILIKVEFPEDDAKPKRARRSSKTEEPEEEPEVESDDDDDDDAKESSPKKAIRRRRRTAADEPKDEPKDAGSPADTDAIIEALVEAFGPTLDGIAKVVLAIQKDVAALKQGQIALAVGALGLDEKETPKDHDGLLEMFGLEG